MARVAKQRPIGNNLSVHGTFTSMAFDFADNGLSVVVFGTVAFSIVMSVALLLTRGPRDSMYDQIGSGGISREGDYGDFASAVDPAVAGAEQEEEVRQMLRARSDRLVSRGQPALDIDAEVARLLAPSNQQRTRESSLLEEVRQLVVARNERRVRQGLEELDIEAEVQRTLDELDP